MIDQWDKHSYLIDDRPISEGSSFRVRAYQIQRIDGYARALTLFGPRITIQQQRDKEIVIEWSWNRTLARR